VVLTVLHAGGKFEHPLQVRAAARRRHLGGQALSEWLDSRSAVRQVWTQRYEYGAPQGEITAGERRTKHGTIRRFKPDTKIFEGPRSPSTRSEPACAGSRS